VLSSDRYVALLDDLDRLTAAPPWTGEADRPAKEMLRKRVLKDWKRLSRRVEALEASSGDPATHDEALHDVRKAAKRLRHALEAVEPVWKKESKPMRGLAKLTTRALGERQDTVLTRKDLVAIADTAAQDGENSFTYGRLHHREEVVTYEQERRFERRWSSASRKQLTGWLA
jgi:CHAD domain-containing protein